MAYRPLRRVLGGTSLEIKCLVLFGTALALLILGSFMWYCTQTDALVYEQNRRNAQGLVHAIIAELHWEELETNPDFRSRVVEPLAIDMQSQKYDWRAIRPNAKDGTGRPQDEKELELLDRWLRTSEPPYEQRHLTEKSEYQYYQPIFTKQTCVDCHRVVDQNKDLAEGDLLAIIQVRTPDVETVKAQSWNRAILATIAIITAFLAMIALYVIMGFVIRKPLKHLRHVSEEISRGNTELRADIHTGDEFEALADAYNRMLRHLSGAQDELRTVNRDLDNKVDELAQVNMRLYEMNRLKSDFLATVSHELRTPLNSIIGFSDVLGSLDVLDDKQRRYVTNIQRSGRMLLEMINDILDLAKIESGKMEVRLSEFSIEHVIASQCEMARPLTEKKNIDLEYDVERGLPDVVQDQGKVQQILSNLLSNAIKFTPEGGRITIAARQTEDNDLALTVADTGVGIAEEDQVAIFEKFRQGTTVAPGGDAMTREFSGTGLGLSIVKELCRLLGGEVSLESELGKGSTFTVTVPWELRQEPRRDASLIDDLEDLAKPRRQDFVAPVAPAHLG